MSTLNHTTTIPTEKTVGEVQGILAKAGADRITVMYTSGQPTGLAFTLPTEFGVKTFELPVNIEGVRALLTDSGPSRHMAKAAYTSREHAARVAWRVIKDWIEAQIALIEARMATIDEVMFPYLLLDSGSTLVTNYRETMRAQQAIEQ